MSSSGEYDTEENKYPLELLNEDIDRMLNLDDELNDALNALEGKYSEMAVYDTVSYGYDTEENKYPLELLNEDIDRMLNSDEFINALNALRASMEKEYFEKAAKRGG
jgi:hypothetical protein